MLLPRSSPSHRRVRRAVKDLELPRPFDVRTLSQSIARRRDRPIVLTALPLSAAGPGGLWLATDSTDYICYEANTSPLHQQHIVLHELGHLLCGHRGAERIDDFARGLAPQLSETTMAIMFSRHRQSHPDASEMEAELFAYFVLERVGELPGRPDASNGLTEGDRRWIEVLEE
ncbi:ImmA/IrrE family metallo-endopeptidase [Micromonospora zamorensis]|uniref:ImmA/IrrE family metallo-endopeptidase n=1 Tax=Micromonospora zamorensis TaxID=709883 RepID=UPI003D98F8A9